jgi:hypothetical protein
MHVFTEAATHRPVAHMPAELRAALERIKIEEPKSSHPK